MALYTVKIACLNKDNQVVSLSGRNPAVMGEQIIFSVFILQSKSYAKQISDPAVYICPPQRTNPKAAGIISDLNDKSHQNSQAESC